MAKNVRRLYAQFKPEHYQLSLDIDTDKMVFKGTVTVSGYKIGRPTERLTFHQKDLKIDSASLKFHDKKGVREIAVERVNTHKAFDEVRLHTKAKLFPGKYTVQLAFSGVITEPMNGMYPCIFKDGKTTKKLIATQFESHHARQVFPSIDEPEAKATFDLTLVTPKCKAVLSNTPVKTQKSKSGQLVSTFETTPVMSTYLLAFVFGDIHSVTTKTKDGIEVSTWATTAQPKSSLEFANKEAQSVLEYFTDYFRIPFPLKKVDQVALPDFESGAMENWGLITYREIALLTDADNRSLNSEQYVAMVVAHELSHQWFGNLVTMKWWDDLWLNESFASLMEHIALDFLHPEWHEWEIFTSNDVISCSNRDVFKDVQPVRVDVRHPDEIGTLFDPAIVYAKGARLLKMLREFIGDEAFRLGLKSYFEKHAYKNTTLDDLWSELAASSQQDIHGFMNPWLEQSGMPVVTLATKNGQLVASQQRFVLDKTNDDSVWPIPTLSANIKPLLFNGPEAALLTKTAPAILNENGSGHYIVNYGSDELKQQVDQAFADRRLPSETRINYLNDLLLLARRGDLSLTRVLEVVAGSNEEPRDAVWSLMSRAVGVTHNLIENDEPAHKLLNNFRRDVAKTLYNQLGWDEVAGDDANTTLLRVTILGWMLGGEDPESKKVAAARYKAADSIQDINADQRGLILASLMKTAPEAHLETLISVYQTSVNPEVQMAITNGLTATKDLKIGKQLINRALGDKEVGFVRFQDVPRWFAYLMRNRHQREATWDWFTANWDRLYQQFGESKSMDNFVVYAAAPINTGNWQKKFANFFSPKRDIVALKRNIKIAEAEIAARVAWRNRDEKNIKLFLSKFK